MVMTLRRPVPAVVAVRERFRWRFWRSPDDQPRWARPSLLGVAAAAALLYGWNLGRSGYAPFYSAAARSMTESWRAFVFGSVDRANTVTIDKLPGFLWPQALSARVFGFHDWSLTLPQVVEGVLAVLFLYRAVRRWAGPASGLIAAGIFAATPVVASMFGHGMEDGALTVCLVVAADAVSRAVREARLRSLVVAGVWVGLGFQAKMLQAWAVLPAFAVAYLVAAPAPLRRRLAHLGIAGGVTVLVSASWMLLVTVTPAHDRPWIDGSTNNNAFSMVVGYNGVSRFHALHLSVPGAVTSGPGLSGGGQRPNASGPPAGFTPPRGAYRPRGDFPGRRGGGGGPGGDRAGWTKLLGAQPAAEVGWLYPLALLSLGFGIAWRGRAGRTDPTRAGFLLWGTWLGVTALGLSAASVPHTAYYASLAAPIAALGGAGIVMFTRTFRWGGARAWALPATIAATLGWVGWLALRHYSSYLPWLVTLALLAGAAGVVLLGVAWLAGAARGRTATAGAVVGVVAMLAVPLAWGVSVLDSRYAGSAFDAAAGPVGGRGGPGGGGGGGGFLNTGGTLSGTERSLLAYVRAHSGGVRYPLTVSGSMAAAPYIVATGEEVLPLGGFSGTVPAVTLATFRRWARDEKVRFVLAGGGGRGGGGAVLGWVEGACAQVPASAYGGGDTTTTGGPGGPGRFGGFGGGGQLYRCDRTSTASAANPAPAMPT
ncbi:MAG: ArnT family glycosyltransferase [Mycobacteriales bacterium]